NEEGLREFPRLSAEHRRRAAGFPGFIALRHPGVRSLGLSFLSATLRLGRLVRPSHPGLSSWVTAHVFVLSCMFSLEGLSPSALLSFTCGAQHLNSSLLALAFERDTLFHERGSRPNAEDRDSD